jgi:NADP-dependent alcohol dehydrogenase
VKIPYFSGTILNLLKRLSMNNFVFHNPTKLVFGKGQIEKLRGLIPGESKIMITFGGGSVKSNDVYDQVARALANHDFIEFWGIEPNPSVETLRKAIIHARLNKIDFLLAVGGGSVLDGTKLIAAGIVYDGDPWEIVLKRDGEESIPYGSVLTLPATGSEMNRNSVISNKETSEKLAFVSSRYPDFSILDPEVTWSLPPYQIACGLTDTFVHVVEQYMTTTGQSRIMDRWAEGIMLTILEIGPMIMGKPANYDLMADFMLSATLALNDMIRMGISQDWATHMIGHELTALHGITHGESLAMVLPGTLKTLKDQKHSKLLQYSERVFGITEGSPDERIDLAIKKTEEFFSSLGLSTRVSEAGIGTETMDIIAERFNKAGGAYGENKNVTGEVARQILTECL